MTELRESVTLDPASGASYAFLGTALREQGDLAGARASLQRAIALLPPTAAVYVDLGIIYLRAGELDKALGQLEAGLNLPSPSLPAPDWDAAIAGLRQAMRCQARARADAHHVLGLLLGRRGAESAAVAAEFREAIRLRPDFAEAHNNLGLVLIQAGDDQAGIAALREAVRLGPDYADAHANLGAALTPTDAEEAIRELEKAVALAPASVKAQFNLALAYGASPSRGPAKEIEQLRKVIDAGPDVRAGAPGAWQGACSRRQGARRDRGAAGSCAAGARERRSALSARPRAVARGPEGGSRRRAPEGPRAGGRRERDQNANLDIAEGRAAARPRRSRASRRQVPPCPAAPARVVRSATVPGETDQHQSRTRTTPRGSPSSKRYIREGKFTDVEPLLAEYVKQRPNSSWGWYALGYSLFAQQKIGESIQALAKSLELDIRNAEAHKILGRNLMIIGRFDAAQVEFEQGIRYKPDSAELHYNLGKLFSIQDNWEPARKAFDAALRIDPSYIEALDALGFALEALGDDAGAVGKYRKAIALNEARQGQLRLAPREPERLLQPHGQS